jgi:hypothetical protein
MQIDLFKNLEINETDTENHIQNNVKLKEN